MLACTALHGVVLQLYSTHNGCFSFSVAACLLLSFQLNLYLVGIIDHVPYSSHLGTYTAGADRVPCGAVTDYSNCMPPVLSQHRQ